MARRRSATKRLPAASTATVVAATLWLSPAVARADVSSWLFVGSGPALVDRRDDDLHLVPSLQLDLGMGLPPSYPVVAGGLLRTRIHPDDGVDLHIMGRLASQGYVNGDWGWAVDGGLFQRTYQGTPTGGSVALTLGAPWGLGATVDGAYGTSNARAFTFTIGIDLLRLTVYRRSGEQWLKNRFPAYRPEEEDPADQ